MQCPASRRLSRAVAGMVLLALSPHQPAAAQPVELWGTLELPRGAAAIRTASGLGDPDRRLEATLLVDFVRRFANTDLRAASLRLEGFLAGAPAADAAPEPERTRLPLPLPALWQSAGLTSSDGTNHRLLHDRRALLTYYGLMALDDETLAALDRNPAVLRTVLDSDTAAAALATFAGSLHIGDHGVMTPGGAEAADVWAHLVGHAPGDVGSFLTRLLTVDGGRLAWFYDALAGLPAHRQRAALALHRPDADRGAAVRRLYNRFASVEPAWRIAARPFHRPPADGWLVLLTVDVADDGTVGQPWWPALFAHVDADSTWTAHAPYEASMDAHHGAADVGWLFDWLFGGRAEQVSNRLAAFRVVQRLFADVPREGAPALHDVIAATLEMPALTASLERMGVADAEVFATMGRAAHALTHASSRENVEPALFRWQAALGLLEQVQLRRRLPAPVLGPLLDELAHLAMADPGAAIGSLAGWIGTLTEVVVGEVDDDSLMASAAPLGDWFIDSATSPLDAKAPLIEWEGLEYEIRADVAAALSARGILTTRPGPRLEHLIAIDRVRRALESGTPDAAGRRALMRRLHALTPAFATVQDAAPEAADALGRILARAGQDGERIADEAPAIADATRLLFDTAVPALLYALAVSPAAEPVLFADAWRRHTLSARPNAALRNLPPWQAQAWQFPVDYGLGGGTRLVGSLLGLDVALADARLVRVADDNVPAPGVVAPWLRIGLVETLVVGTAPAPPADTVVDALATGRARLAAWATTPVDRRQLARRLRDSGVDAWRANGVAWDLAHGGAAALETLSLTEVFWIGGGDSTLLASASSRLVDGCLCPIGAARIPGDRLVGRRLGLQSLRPLDIDLRLAELVDDLDLDARLVRPIRPMALQDWLDRSQPAGFDDLDAFTFWPHDLTARRVEQYLLHLLTMGVLRPPLSEGQP